MIPVLCRSASAFSVTPSLALLSCLLSLPTRFKSRRPDLSSLPVLLLMLSLLVTLLGARPLHASVLLERPALPMDAPVGVLLTDVVRAGDRLVAVGERGYVFYSDDGGRSWQQGRVPTSVMLTGVHFVDAEFGWAVGHEGVVLRSSDGGRSWTRLLDSQTLHRLTRDWMAQRLDALADAAAGPEAEALAIWLDEADFALNEGSAAPLLDLWFFNRREGIVVGAYGQVLFTADGGEHWQPWQHRLPNPDRLHYNTLAVDPEGGLWVAGEAGLLLRSGDRGETWERLSAPYAGSFFKILAPGEVDQSLLLLGLRGNLFRQQPGGWEALSWSGKQTLAGAARGADGVLLVGSGGLLLSLQQGRLEERVLPQWPGLSGVAWAGDAWVVVGEQGAQRLETWLETDK